jgi:transposase
MTPTAADPDDVETLRAALAAEREARIAAEVCATGAEARAVGAGAMSADLTLVIAKLRHDKFGASSERGRKLLNQLELELGELVATTAEDVTRAENQAETRPGALPPRMPSRGPLPACLPAYRGSG